MKKRVKIAIIITSVILGIAVLSAAFLFVCLAGITITRSGMKNAEKYRNCDWGDCVYFTEDDFGEYESAEYNIKIIWGFFSSRGSMYTVTYSDEQYKKQLEKIDAMEFTAVPYMHDDDLSRSFLSEEKTEKNGRLIRVLKPENEYDFPKKFGMILTDDDEKTIIYMYFTDPDLDCILGADGEDALVKFIEKYFSFRF